MINTSYLYVANWKMNLSVQEELSFAALHYDKLVALAADPSRTIILCPSFLSLHELCIMFAQTPVVIGAQDCSDHYAGPYTGQISAQALHAIGCGAVIIGHLERRIYNCETNKTVVAKMHAALQQGLLPIVCVGESAADAAAGKALTNIDEQLNLILQELAEMPSLPDKSSIAIAYEPASAVGTGKIAESDHIEVVLAHIDNRLKAVSRHFDIKLLYGGSVTAAHTPDLKRISQIQGFLIGNASLNFTELKKIVE